MKNMNKKITGFSVEKTKDILTEIYQDSIEELYDKTVQNGAEGDSHAKATCHKYSASDAEKAEFLPLYGEVRAIAIKRLFEAANDDIDVFIDIGSGIAKTILAAALMYPDGSKLKEIIGIEGRSTMIQASNEVIDYFLDDKYEKPANWQIQSQGSDHRIIKSTEQTLMAKKGIFNYERKNRQICNMLAAKTKNKKTLALFNVNLGDEDSITSAAKAFDYSLPKDENLLGIITYNAQMKSNGEDKREDFANFLNIMENHGFEFSGDVWINTSWGTMNEEHDKGTFFGHFIRKGCKVDFNHFYKISN